MLWVGDVDTLRFFGAGFGLGAGFFGFGAAFFGAAFFGAAFFGAAFFGAALPMRARIFAIS